MRCRCKYWKNWRYSHWHRAHWSSDDIGAPTFTDINMSDISLNVGAPTSSMLQCISVSVVSVTSKLTPHIPTFVAFVKDQLRELLTKDFAKKVSEQACSRSSASLRSATPDCCRLHITSINHYKTNPHVLVQRWLTIHPNILSKRHLNPWIPSNTTSHRYRNNARRYDSFKAWFTYI